MSTNNARGLGSDFLGENRQKVFFARTTLALVMVVVALVVWCCHLILKSNDFEEVAVQAVKEVSALKVEVAEGKAAVKESARAAMSAMAAEDQAHHAAKAADRRAVAAEAAEKAARQEEFNRLLSQEKAAVVPVSKAKAEAAKAEVPVVPVVPVPAEASVEKTLDAALAASKAQEAASEAAKALAAKEWKEARDAAAAQWGGLYRKAVAWSQRKAAEQAAEEAAAKEAAAKAAIAAPKLEPAPAPRVIQDPWAEVRAARNWGLAPAPK